MENKAEAQYKPQWGIADDVAVQLDQTLDLDAGKQTRTIRARAETPGEINQMFDGITYQKGGAVIGMVEKYLGEETFRKGVHDYLEAHKYANATAEDFWNAQTQDSGKPIDKIMASFIAQPGVPLLSFGERADGRVAVAQSRFFITPDATAATAQTWTVPVCVKSGASPDCTVLSPSETSVAAPADGEFFANANAHGYYRSLYPASNVAALMPKVESTLSAEERILLLGDEWALMRADRGSLADVLNLMTVLRDDPSAGVLGEIGGTYDGAVLGKLEYLDEKVASDADRKQMSAWVRAEFGPAYKALPAAQTGDSYELSERRAILFRLLGTLGHDPAVIAQAREITDRWVQDPASVNPTLSQSALTIAAQNGDAALFDSLQHLAETSSDPAVQSRSLRLLPQFKDPALEERLLEYAVSGKVRNQDASALVAEPMRGRETRELAWQFVQTHWDQVHALLTPLSGGRVITAAGSFCSTEKRQEVDSFYATHKFSDSPRPLQIADGQISSCTNLRETEEPKLSEWLSRVNAGQ